MGANKHDRRCLLTDAGGIFYSSPEKATGLAKTIREAVALFEPFKQRLHDMDDPDYRRRVCSPQHNRDEL